MARGYGDPINSSSASEDKRKTGKIVPHYIVPFPAGWLSVLLPPLPVHPPLAPVPQRSDELAACLGGSGLVPVQRLHAEQLGEGEEGLAWRGVQQV